MSVDRSLHRWVRTWWSGGAGMSGGIASLLTLPLEGAYRLGTRARNRLYDREILPTARVTIPVVSVGNLTVGGTGKTPMAAWLARTLREHGKNPWILLRGYGTDEVKVHSELNPEVPIGLGKDRAEAARTAQAGGADCLILDDGFQHRRLDRNLDIVLVAAEQWRTRGRLLPRGPWRESTSALGRAAFVVVTRKSASRAEAEAVLREVGQHAPGLPTALVHLGITSLNPLEPTAPLDVPAAGEALAAVSSLGNPDAFEEQLRAMGSAVRPIRFPDHHTFTTTDIETIVRQAGGARIVMTRKEAVKLRGRLPEGVDALVADQGVTFELGGEEFLRTLLKAVS